MNLFSRMQRHLLTTASAGKRAFPQATVKAIEAAIAAGETLHRAEVCLIVEAALPLQAIMHGVTARERASALFTQHRIWDTEENCGVLIYVNLADHKVEIVTDRAVGRLILASDWQAICHAMAQGFARGTFHDSTLAALTRINALLQQHFPANGTRSNQIVNKPIIL